MTISFSSVRCRLLVPAQELDTCRPDQWRSTVASRLRHATCAPRRLAVHGCRHRRRQMQWRT